MSLRGPMQFRPDAPSPESITPVPRVAEGEPVLMLDAKGIVQDCSAEGESLFGYRRSELVSQHVSVVLPQLAGMDLIEDGCLNAHLMFHSRIGGYFHVLNRLGDRVAVDLFVNDLGRQGVHRLRLIVRRDERREAAGGKSREGGGRARG